MPAELRERLSVAKLQESQTETLLEEPVLARFAADLVAVDVAQAKIIINWLTGEITKLVSDSKLNWGQVVSAKELFLELAILVSANKLSSTSAKSLLLDMINSKQSPEKLAEEKNLLQVSDKGVIEKIVAEVLSENEKAANDVKNGEMKAIGFLIGQVMAKSKGKANPSLAQQIIKELLSI